MSIRKVNHILEHVRYRPAEKMILVVMADVADELGYCWPGIDYIAERASVSRRSTISLLKVMEKRGDLFVKKTRGKSNKYIILVQTTKEEFVELATAKLEMDDREARDAYLRALNLEQSEAVKASRTGAKVAPLTSARFARHSSAKSALPGTRARFAPLITTSIDQCKICTGAKTAPVQPNSTRVVQLVAPDPLITIKKISSKKGNSILDLLESMLAKDIFNTALRGSKFVQVEKETIFIQPASESAAAWLEGALKPQILNISKVVLERDINEVAIWAK